MRVYTNENATGTGQVIDGTRAELEALHKAIAKLISSGQECDAFERVQGIEGIPVVVIRRKG